MLREGRGEGGDLFDRAEVSNELGVGLSAEANQSHGATNGQNSTVMAESHRSDGGGGG